MLLMMQVHVVLLVFLMTVTIETASERAMEEKKSHPLQEGTMQKQQQVLQEQRATLQSSETPALAAPLTASSTND